MKLRDIVLSVAVGLGSIGCNDQKIISLHDPKPDSIAVDSSNSPYILETGFRKGLKINEITYQTKQDTQNTFSVIKWFYDDKGREIRIEYNGMEPDFMNKLLIGKNIGQLKDIDMYDKNKWWSGVYKTDYNDDDSTINLEITIGSYKHPKFK